MITNKQFILITYLVQTVANNQIIHEVLVIILVVKCWNVPGLHFCLEASEWLENNLIVVDLVNLL